MPAIRKPLVILTLALALAAVAASPASALDARLVSVGKFAAPVYVTSPPADASRLFVVERAGTIQVLRNGTRKKFLDISAKTTTEVERGLLSMAFAPDYATSRRFYVYYTTNGGDIRIEEYRRSASNADTADPSSARPLLTIEHSTFPNHNGGQLQFGPDGFLYAGTGDGGAAGDPFRNGQNTGTLLGKLLRIDPRNGSPYAVPAGNPFDSPVYDYGLRNPYRFSFDRKTGDLIIGDVGQDLHEEIDFRAAGSPGGANFGWSCREGKSVYTSTSDPKCSATTNPPSYVAPVLDYPHSGGGCSIIGGYVVRDPTLTTLNGRYVYGDLCTSKLRSVDLARPSGDRAVTTNVTLPGSGLVSFGEDSHGCVYVVSIAGPVYRMQPATGSASCVAPGMTPNPTGFTLGISGRRHQSALSAGALRIAVRCTAACAVRTGTTIAIEGSDRRYKLARVSRLLAAKTRVTVELALTDKVHTALSKALGRDRTGLATVNVSAKTASGAVDRDKRRFRILG